MKLSLRTLAAVCCALFCFHFQAQAQSTVYVFIKSVANSDVSVKLNGKKISDLNGPVRKKIQPTVYKIPYVTREACVRKFTLSEEGKVILSVEIDFTNGMTLEHTKSAGETQLNLTPGSVHYLFATNKGFSDLQIKPMDEKEAAKLAKKYKELPEVKK